MLSIHSVSIMMRIFYIDWKQHWKYDRTMNIGANAHGKRAVSTLKIATGDRLDLRWQLGFQWHGIGIELVLQVPRLFHSATIFCCYICTCICCLKLHRVGEGFFNSIWWGPLSSNVFTICAVYWSLGRRGYFGVSNVALVYMYSWCQSSAMDANWHTDKRLCSFHEISMSCTNIAK